MLSLSLSRAPSLLLSHIHTHIHTHARTHTHTHTLSLSLSLSFSLTFGLYVGRAMGSQRAVDATLPEDELKAKALELKRQGKYIPMHLKRYLVK